MNHTTRDFIKDVLFGVSIGDALGVPVEFNSRKTIAINQVTDMRAYGTHRQPAGTWSDDSSLTFCLAEMLSKGYDLQGLGNRFVNWKDYGYWTAHGSLFDIGIATSAAIYELRRGVQPVLAGGVDEGSNGNGSLMRILPLMFYVKDMPIAERFQYVKDVSSLTHRHIRSVIACFIYIEYALQLYNGVEKQAAFESMCKEVNGFLVPNHLVSQKELDIFQRILAPQDIAFGSLPEDEIKSSGYVLHTLEASLWCLLTTNNYKDAVLKAVNLGEDTDTTGAVTGGLAGLLYSWESIPAEWMDVLAKKDDIAHLAVRMSAKIFS